MRESTYELSERVLNEPGSLREIGVALGISKTYVSMLKKARANCSAKVQDRWREGDINWRFVRALSHLESSFQDECLERYMSEARGVPAKGPGAAEGRARLKVLEKFIIEGIREYRGVGTPTALEAEIYAEAEALYGDDDCQIERKKIVPVEDGAGVDGYWVPAMVWVPAENINTEG